jgi:hypothetical protein
MHVRQRRVRDVDDLRGLEDLRAVARPPRAPAERTDKVPRPLLREDDADERVALVFRAVARPPVAPAVFFCALVPARPPRAPAARTLSVPRPLDAFRAVVFLRLAVLRLAVLRVAAFRVAVFREAVFRDVVAFREAVLRAVVAFRVAVFRAVVVLRRLDDVLLRDELDELRPRADEPPLRDDEPDDEEREEDDEREDDPPDFDSPDWARCLLTVRAAISFARPVERPCFFSESLMCSY